MLPHFQLVSALYKRLRTSPPTGSRLNIGVRSRQLMAAAVAVGARVEEVVGGLKEEMAEVVGRDSLAPTAFKLRQCVACKSLSILPPS